MHSVDGGASGRAGDASRCSRTRARHADSHTPSSTSLRSRPACGSPLAAPPRRDAYRSFSSASTLLAMPLRMRPALDAIPRRLSRSACACSNVRTQKSHRLSLARAVASACHHRWGVEGRRARGRRRRGGPGGSVPAGSCGSAAPLGTARSGRYPHRRRRRRRSGRRRRRSRRRCSRRGRRRRPRSSPRTRWRRRPGSATGAPRWRRSARRHRSSGTRPRRCSARRGEAAPGALSAKGTAARVAHAQWGFPRGGRPPRGMRGA